MLITDEILDVGLISLMRSDIPEAEWDSLPTIQECIDEEPENLEIMRAGIKAVLLACIPLIKRN